MIFEHIQEVFIAQHSVGVRVVGAFDRKRWSLYVGLRITKHYKQTKKLNFFYFTKKLSTFL
jgi:hypothetical protein